MILKWKRVLNIIKADLDRQTYVFGTSNKFLGLYLVQYQSIVEFTKYVTKLLQNFSNE